MKGFVEDIEALTKANKDVRQRLVRVLDAAPVARVSAFREWPSARSRAPVKMGRRR